MQFVVFFFFLSVNSSIIRAKYYFDSVFFIYIPLNCQPEVQESSAVKCYNYFCATYVLHYRIGFIPHVIEG